MATVALAAFALPAQADTIGMRPLGAHYESARTVGEGHWIAEIGGWMPTFDEFETPLNTADQEVFDRWQGLPAWPDVRVVYGYQGTSEASLHLGSQVTGAYRRHMLRAEAPWGGEYLQGLLQVGGGYHLASRDFMGYLRLPGIYERGDWTFNVAPGGYYLLNEQPVVEVNAGMEYRPIAEIAVGVNARLRMDSKKISPLDGKWSFGGGARYQILPRLALQLDAFSDGGPPTGEGTQAAKPRIEFPLKAVQASVMYQY